MLRNKFKKDILNGNVFEQLLLLLFPVFLGYLLQQIYGFVDAMVLGKFAGKQALASVGGSATAIINVILNIISGMTTAVTVLVAQNYGKGDSRKVISAIRTGFFVAVCFGGLLTAIVLLSGPSLLKLMGEPLDSINTSLIYLRFYAAAFIPYFIYQTGICILRALGDNKRPNYFILITAVTKIAFDLLLAGVFKLGVLGTSCATFLSYLICAIATFIVFALTTDFYSFNIKDFGFETAELKAIFRMGTPFAIQNAAFAVPSLILQSKINQFGTDAIAAYSAYCQVDNLFWCYANAVSTAALTIVGQNYGNDNIARVRKTVYASMLTEICGSISFGAAFTFFGKELLSLFVNDVEVIEIGNMMLKVTATRYLLHMFVGTVGAACKGCGSGRFVAISSIFTILLTRVIFLIFYPHSLPSHPVYCFPISWIATSLLYSIYFFTNKKLKPTKAKA